MPISISKLEPETYSGIRFLIVSVCLLFFGFMLSACGSKWQPGYFDKPTKAETHGRITEKQYYAGDYYNVLEVDGKPLRIPNGYVEFTNYCEVEGIDAVAFTVRGRPGAPGVFILQVHGDETIFERLCDYKTPLGHWEDSIYRGCSIGWDAKQRKRFSD